MEAVSTCNLKNPPFKNSLPSSQFKYCIAFEVGDLCKTCSSWAAVDLFTRASPRSVTALSEGKGQIGRFCAWREIRLSPVRCFPGAAWVKGSPPKVVLLWDGFLFPALFGGRQLLPTGFTVTWVWMVSLANLHRQRRSWGQEGNGLCTLSGGDFCWLLTGAVLRSLLSHCLC